MRLTRDPHTGDYAITEIGVADLAAIQLGLISAGLNAIEGKAGAAKVTVEPVGMHDRSEDPDYAERESEPDYAEAEADAYARREREWQAYR